MNHGGKMFLLCTEALFLSFIVVIATKTPLVMITNKTALHNLAKRLMYLSQKIHELVNQQQLKYKDR